MGWTRPLAEGPDATTRGRGEADCRDLGYTSPVAAAVRRSRVAPDIHSGCGRLRTAFTYPADLPCRCLIPREHAGLTASTRRVRGV